MAYPMNSCTQEQERVRQLLRSVMLGGDGNESGRKRTSSSSSSDFLMPSSSVSKRHASDALMSLCKVTDTELTPYLSLLSELDPDIKIEDIHTHAFLCRDQNEFSHTLFSSNASQDPFSSSLISPMKNTNEKNGAGIPQTQTQTQQRGGGGNEEFEEEDAALFCYHVPSENELPFVLELLTDTLISKPVCMISMSPITTITTINTSTSSTTSTTAAASAASASSAAGNIGSIIRLFFHSQCDTRNSSKANHEHNKRKDTFFHASIPLQGGSIYNIHNNNNNNNNKSSSSNYSNNNNNSSSSNYSNNIFAYRQDISSLDYSFHESFLANPLFMTTLWSYFQSIFLAQRMHTLRLYPLLRPTLHTALMKRDGISIITPSTLTKLAHLIDFGGISPTPQLLLDLLTSEMTRESLIRFAVGIAGAISSLVVPSYDNMDITSSDVEDAENDRLIREFKVILRAGGWWNEAICAELVSNLQCEVAIYEPDGPQPESACGGEHNEEERIVKVSGTASGEGNIEGKGRNIFTTEESVSSSQSQRLKEAYMYILAFAYSSPSDNPSSPPPQSSDFRSVLVEEMSKMKELIFVSQEMYIKFNRHRMDMDIDMDMDTNHEEVPRERSESICEALTKLIRQLWETSPARLYMSQSSLQLIWLRLLTSTIVFHAISTANSVQNNAKYSFHLCLCTEFIDTFFELCCQMVDGRVDCQDKALVLVAVADLLDEADLFSTTPSIPSIPSTQCDDESHANTKTSNRNTKNCVQMTNNKNSICKDIDGAAGGDAQGASSTRYMDTEHETIDMSGSMGYYKFFHDVCHRACTDITNKSYHNRMRSVMPPSTSMPPSPMFDNLVTLLKHRAEFRDASPLNSFLGLLTQQQLRDMKMRLNIKDFRK